MDEPNLDWTGVVSERLIREAAEAGVFDNLPGQGKPLPDEVLFTPAYQRFANRALKEAKVLPEWMELEREIRTEVGRIDEVRSRLLKAICMARDDASRAHLAERLRKLQRERMSLINNLVLKYNLHVPAPVQKSFRAFRVSEEMQALEQEIETALKVVADSPVSAAPRRRRRMSA